MKSHLKLLWTNIYEVPEHNIHAVFKHNLHNIFLIFISYLHNIKIINLKSVENIWSWTQKYCGTQNFVGQKIFGAHKHNSGTQFYLDQKHFWFQFF